MRSGASVRDSTQGGKNNRMFGRSANAALLTSRRARQPALKPIVPILLASHVDIVVGRVGDDPSLSMQVGPVGGPVEATPLNLIEPHVSIDGAPVLT